MMKSPLILFLLLSASPLWAATYYVDSSITDTHVASSRPDFTTYNPSTFSTATGSASVYKTIADVNAKHFSAGDSILFRRGQTWREHLIPQSGSAAGGYITYGVYGTGAKPKLLGSVQKHSPSDWKDEGSNIWSISLDAGGLGSEMLANPSFATDTAGWYLYVESPADATGSGRTTIASECDGGAAGYKVVCVNHGNTYDQIELKTQPYSITAGIVYKLTFRAKATAGVTIHVPLAKNGSPFTDYASVHSQYSPPITTSWATYTVYYKSNASASDAAIRWYLGGPAVPSGARVYIGSVSLRPCTGRDVIIGDVGNLIFEPAHQNLWARHGYGRCASA